MITADDRLTRVRELMRVESDKRAGVGKPTSSAAGGDNASYPFFDIPEGKSATLRFLPDGNPDNPWFWVERQTIKLPFQGIDGGDYPTDAQVWLTVPCADMFAPRSCPVIKATAPWWRDDAKKEQARLYYKKRSYIFQGFVVSSPLEESELPANPIRRFVFGPSLLAKIKTGLADPDLEAMPTDADNGCDFRLRKTRKQDYNNYDTSEFARKSRALTEEERAILEEFPLLDLSQFLGTRPDPDTLLMIKAMFDDSVAGAPFDFASYGHAFRPYGGGGPRASDGNDTPAAQQVAQPLTPELLKSLRPRGSKAA